MLNLPGYQDGKAPQTPRAGSDQPYGLDCTWGIREHVQGDGLKSSALMRTTYFIPYDSKTTTRDKCRGTEGLTK